MYWQLPQSTVLQSGIMAAFLVCCASGCGGSSGYNVSGFVTFKGAPVPAGKIYFTPDGSKGNSGEQGYSDIRDGKYDTASTGGKGTVGGPMIVGIEGVDPSGLAQAAKGDTSGEQAAATLFPLYEVAVDLPKENTTKDFEVPAEAATRQDVTETPGVTP